MGLRTSGCSVITGAGGGFGRALAFELAARGARLVLSDINPGAAEETARLALARGAAAAKALGCDVTKVEEVEALANACEGPIDLLVNNAGVSSGGLVGDLSLTDWRWTIEVDLFGVIHGCHVFVPRLKKQGAGHILNVASAAGLLCAPRMAAYNAAKAGVIAISETLAVELDDTGVGVTVLCPTFFKTDIVNSGRFADPETRKMADKLMAGGRPVEEVVLAALAAVERDELYAVPMADARWLWRVKRALPDAFRKLVGLGVRFRSKD
ncbi:SDR family NAD(P)-dependent oxidoreductase [Polyangium sp. y55x31]|uniref:SDR family NAD(P)-dependent oxidoreductase n=1 Tax=Polyangium sp. y55x31 TaxID=3042688 RepID=UPI0024828846|nr:SDR family NAD(P)-dependent oxidoreductase [Polyangium sp. y55x31]MDI1480779.1 SDR family NAD(P)-dependent oxidoreductase [Polyangium sp. y55x31]